jgi:putative adenylate-forming enzyme
MMGKGRSLAMNTRIMLKVLRMRRQLRRRDLWTREQLEEHQARSLRLLREYAYARSPFYQRFHRGLEDRPLNELPVLTKAMLMEHFGELVTDPMVRLANIEEHVASLQGNERYLGRYYVASTSGSTGRRGLFLWNLDEWVSVLASYNRAFDWAGSRMGLSHRTKMAFVSSTTPWHQSVRVGASVHSPLVSTVRLDSGDSVESIVDRLNGFKPEVLVAYASMVHILAEEQLAGRLGIYPEIVFSASEVLTDETRRSAEEAWGRKPFNVYAATETAGIASECDQHRGMHLFEDLVIPEIVDEKNDPVPPGVYGDKVLVSVLFSRTLPLIRYEMSDSVRLSERSSCPCGRPFALIDGIQGRAEDVLRFPAASGGEVAVQPNVFHRVMDTVPAAGWQVVQEPGGLTVLLSGVRDDFSERALTDSLRRELAEKGVIAPRLEVRRVPEIPKGPMGKAPLIRAMRPSVAPFPP